MLVNFEMKNIAHHAAYLLQARVAELMHFIAARAYQVVVLPVAVGALIQGHIIAELVLYHQARVKKQVQRIIHCGAAYVVVLILHLEVKHFHIEMVAAAVDLLQYRKSLQSLPLLLLLEVLAENFRHLFIDN